MARKSRSLQRRSFRFSLDPLDPVEGEALRRIDEQVVQAKDILGADITQEEAERFAFKGLLLGLLRDAPAVLVSGRETTSGQPAKAGVEQSTSAAVVAPAAVSSPQPAVIAAPAEPEAPAPASASQGENEVDASQQTPGSWQEQLLENGQDNKATPMSPVLSGLAWQAED